MPFSKTATDWNDGGTRSERRRPRAKVGCFSHKKNIYEEIKMSFEHALPVECLKVQDSIQIYDHRSLKRCSGNLCKTLVKFYCSSIEAYLLNSIVSGKILNYSPQVCWCNRLALVMQWWLAGGWKLSLTDRCQFKNSRPNLPLLSMLLGYFMLQLEEVL